MLGEDLSTTYLQIWLLIIAYDGEAVLDSNQIKVYSEKI